MAPEGRTRLVVLFGGRSAEHDVSCTSAMHVLDAVDRDRYDVVPVGITREGRWLSAGDAIAALPAGAAALPSPDVLQRTEPEVDPLPTVAAADGAPVVVLPLVHGPMGEDGTVQGLLELAGVPYVGAGVLASALCMDKGVAKDVLARHGLPQCRYRVLRAPDATPAGLDEVAGDLGLPAFVKPANMGSSVGVGRAASRDELSAAVAEALRFDEYVVVEEGLERPREIELGVLGDEDPKVTVPGEVLPSRDFYDFDDKYLAGASGFRIPAELTDDQAAEAQDLAMRTYRALRVDGMARVDLFLTADRGFLVNEVNTIPGFTEISMFPKMWEASGLPYPQLVDELVRLAVARHARRSRFATQR